MAKSAAGGAASTTDSIAGSAETGKAGGNADAKGTKGDASTKTGKAAGDGDAGDQGDAGDGKGKTTGKAKPAGKGEGADEGEQGDEGKGSKKTGGKDDAAGAAKKAPEKYELEVPDAMQELVADEDLAFIEEVARANDWTQDEAQAELTAHLDRASKRLEAQATKWREETEADEDYGGDAMKETTKRARSAIAAIRPEGHPRRDSFLRFLNRGGAGNHIEVVSFLADLGKMLGEDAPTHARSRASAKGKQGTAETLYDHPTSKALDEKTTR